MFTRNGLGEPFQAAYLTLVAEGKVPQFKKDADGWAETVPVNSAELAVPPGEVGQEYATYLKSGGDTFADGAYTSTWRAAREKDGKRPGLVTQYIDEPMTSGDYQPLALRTKDGGALVFFATHLYTKQTAAPGTSIPTNDAVRALTTGEIKQSLTMEIVSNSVAVDPPKGAGKQQVTVLGRIQGLTSAKGS